MSTAEIAEAVNVSTSWKNLHFRLMCLACTYAFTTSSCRYFLYFSANILWIFVTPSCVMVVERRTNHYTIKSYSTPHVVDHSLKKHEIEGINLRMIVLFAVVGPYLGFMDVEAMLFLLMRKEMERLKERNSLSPCQEKGWSNTVANPHRLVRFEC